MRKPRFRTTPRKRLHEGLVLLWNAFEHETALPFVRGRKRKLRIGWILEKHTRAQACLQLAKGEV